MPQNYPDNQLIADLPYEDYARAPGINQTGLGYMLHSGAKYQHYLQKAGEETAPEEESDALHLGKVTHLCILEPDEYEARVCVRPDFKPKKGKNPVTAKAQREVWESELVANAIVVTQKTHDKVQAMRDSVWANADARALLAKGQREASVWWQDAQYNVRCKARLDFVSQAHSTPVCLDLKTAENATRLAFSKSVTNYRYDMQMHHYLSGGQHTKLYDPKAFFFLVVEKQPPYDCTVFSVSEHVRTVGFKWWEEAMSLYAQAHRSGQWEHLPAADEVGLPKYAKVPGEEDEYIA